MTKCRPAVTDRYCQQNQQAALVVLRDVERYGGSQAGLVKWARMIVDGHQHTRAEWGAVA